MRLLIILAALAVCTGKLSLHFGENNPGRKLKADEFDFGFVLTFGADSYCLDFDSWCRDQQTDLLINDDQTDATFANPDFGRAWVASNVLCYMAEDLVYNTSAALVAQGTWKIDHQDGSNVRKIELITSIHHVGMAIANSSAVANTNASADGYAYAYTDSDELCNYLRPDGGWGEYLCGSTNATSEIMGLAEASGISSGAARAQAGGIGAQESTIYVEADYISAFSAMISAVAGSFAFTSAQATVDAVTDAYMLASAASYVETCQTFIEEECVDLCEGDQDCIDTACTEENCDFSYATNNVNTTAVGESLGRTLATSFDQALFTMSTQATYNAIVGATSIYDQINFGYEAMGYYGADVVAECKVANVISEED